MNQIDKGTLENLRGFDTCTVSNAIERFGVRLRNTGFTDASIRAIFPDLPPMVGYATTARVRTEDPPMTGRFYHDRTDWWNSILATPAPRIVVLEDMDKHHGLGAFIGDVHAAILKALGCIGFVTDGAVREIPAIQAMRLPVFAGHVAVSHSYAHVFDVGAVVKIGGLDIHPGDLLHGDRHGVLNVPENIAPRIPAVAATLKKGERKVIQFCESPSFSVEGLQDLIRRMDESDHHVDQE